MSGHERTSVIDTPFGRAALAADGAGCITRFWLLGDAASPEDTSILLASASERKAAREATERAVTQLEEYFAGTRQHFELALAPRGSEFQRRVWQELAKIPYGQTITYTQLAERLGDPNCVRAAGRANGANPIWIIIPCHRVVGADGGMTGYAGGVDVKRALLELEGNLLDLRAGETSGSAPQPAP